MKKFSLHATLPLIAATVIPLFAQPLTLPEASPKASVSQTIGITDVSVAYHRPAVNKREVWGKLVPYGYGDLGFGTSKAAPWRAGANENTLVTFQHDVTVAGQPLKAGAYALFMAVEPTGEVTVIFSRDNAHWGSFFYDQSRDALRVNVKWEDAPFHELLTYEFTDVTKDSAVLSLLWEKKRIPIPLKTDTQSNVVASMKAELRNSKGFAAKAWVDGVNYLLENNLDMQLALEWCDYALTARFVGERTFATLSAKGQVLERLGRVDESKKIMDEALRLATAGEIHQYGRQLLAQKKAERALEVFKLNVELHPNVWPVNYGLARGYSAVGNYQAALEAIEKAQKQVPAGDTINANAIKVNIEKLKRGENIN